MAARPPHYEEPLGHFSALWGDQYALTMSQAFFSNGKHDLNATFHPYIRKAPYGGTYLVTGGQNVIFEWLADHWRFDDRDIALMKTKTVLDPRAGKLMPLYTPDFIDMVQASKMELTIDAMPEGEIAFADEPIYRVHGPLWQGLMAETAILNATNSQSLFATLASRLMHVTEGAPVLEFSLRRVHSLGGLEQARGAWIGGVTGTSNMLAEKYYGIPTVGTFAHAFVMTYEDELEAFHDYARGMPYNGVFLVDTYNTVEGVKKAITTCRDLGIALKGIRLDSGDLAYLSKAARKLMDDSGFTDAKVIASNDLDEDTIASLKAQGAKIDIWAVGTNLGTSKAQPALGAVYKLGAVFNGSLTQAEIDSARLLARQGVAPSDPAFMRDVLKLSEQTEKTTIPGELDVLRSITQGSDGKDRFDGDVIISNFRMDPTAAAFGNAGILARDIVSIRKNDDTLRKTFNAGSRVYQPLQRAFTQGAWAGTKPIGTVHDAREQAAKSIAMLDPTHLRLKNPHVYGVGIEEALYQHRRQMIMNLRGLTP